MGAVISIVASVFSGLAFLRNLVLADLLLGFLAWQIGLPILAGYLDDRRETKISQALVDAKKDELEAASSRSESGEPRVAGWMTVRRRFAPLSNSRWFGTSSKLSPADIFILDETSSDIAEVGGPSAEPLTQSASLAKAYRKMANQQTKEKPASNNDIFWGELNGRVLALFDGPKKEKRIAEINICDKEVQMWTKRGRFEGRDSQMFNKKNMIALRPGTSSPTSSEKPEKIESGEDNDEEGCIYIGCKTSPFMEDVYLALLENSKNSASAGTTFSQVDMQNLVDLINSEPDELNARWLNALLGRLFYGVYMTRIVEEALLRKLRNKLAKTDLGAFVTSPEVTEFHVGSMVPWFSKPMLKESKSDGYFSMHVHGRYEAVRPEDRLYISASAIVSLPMPMSGRRVTTKIAFKVYLNKLEGDLELKIKGPPSNRLWYGFTSAPVLDLSYEFTRTAMNFLANSGPAKSMIDSAIKTLIASNIVLPNMDDVAFLPTTEEAIRGGIFGFMAKGHDESPSEPVTASLELPSVKTDMTEEAKFRLGLLSRDRRTKTLAPGVAEAIENSETIRRSGSAPADIDQKPKWFRSSSKTPPQSLPLEAKAVDDVSILSLDPAVLTSQLDEPPMKREVDSRPSRRSSDDTLPGSLKKSLTGLSRKISPPGRAKRSSETSPPSSTSSTPIAPETSSIRSGAASLISEIRGRDRTAPVRDQVSNVFDMGKKSWAGLRARRVERATQAAERPIPVYRPTDHDQVAAEAQRRATGASHSAALSLDLNRTTSPPTLSLHDRLNAVARVAAGDIPTGGRDRASSVSSRLSLSSPPTNAALGSTPPKGWTLTSSGPTTDIARPQVSPPKLETGRSVPPPPPPVSRQPVPGKSMVVPRVPKRPGQVIGIGSSGGSDGLMRRISSSEGADIVENKKAIEPIPIPPLPKPKRGESLLPLYSPPSPPKNPLPTNDTPPAPEKIPLPPSPPIESTPSPPITPPPVTIKKAQLADVKGEGEPLATPATAKLRGLAREEIA